MKIENLTKKYGERTVFNRLSMEITEGEISCVLGASGVGKTTLLRALAGLTDFEGEIDAPAHSAFVFQEPRLLAHLTVEENLRFACGDSPRIEEIMKKTEIYAYKDKRAGRLSGGEQQRVAIARAFLSNAPLLLLDEPFSSLDTALKIRLIGAFAKLWQEEHRTAVMVTHDIEEAWMIGHRIVVLDEGKIVYDYRPTRSAFPTPYGEKSAGKDELLQVLLKKER
ncbi:MAG: ATP-binding cassette domain-containing protein [Clostridia bacterium]|nr:ATP-binding cassette domain-containing protein [Clostridia bacterium]